MSKKTIKEQVQEETKAAMRAQDKARLMILRLILSEYKSIEVNERIELDETRELMLLDKMQKQRRDSISQFSAAGRDELVAKEQYEFDVIQSFKPAALDDQAIDELVKAAIKESGAQAMQDMNKVMTLLKPKLQGRADMGQVSAKIKAMLTPSQ